MDPSREARRRGSAGSARARRSVAAAATVAVAGTTVAVAWSRRPISHRRPSTGNPAGTPWPRARPRDWAAHWPAGPYRLGSVGTGLAVAREVGGGARSWRRRGPAPRRVGGGAGFPRLAPPSTEADGGLNRRSRPPSKLATPTHPPEREVETNDSDR